MSTVPSLSSRLSSTSSARTTMSTILHWHLIHQSEIQHQERVSYLSDSGSIESPDITSVRCTLVTLTLPLVLIAVTIDIFMILLDSYKYTYRNPIKSGIIIMNVPCYWWFPQFAHLNILRVWMRHSDLLGHWVWGAEQYIHEGSFWARSRCGSANRVQRGVKVSGLVHSTPPSARLWRHRWWYALPGP